MSPRQSGHARWHGGVIDPSTIILFALIGKVSDMILVALARPFLRHEDSFAGGDR